MKQYLIWNTLSPVWRRLPGLLFTRFHWTTNFTPRGIVGYLTLEWMKGDDFWFLPFGIAKTTDHGRSTNVFLQNKHVCRLSISKFCNFQMQRCSCSTSRICKKYGLNSMVLLYFRVVWARFVYKFCIISHYIFVSHWIIIWFVCVIFCSPKSCAYKSSPPP